MTSTMTEVATMTVSEVSIGTESTNITIPKRYLDRAVARHKTEHLLDGKLFVEIPGFAGVWASGETERDAVEELYDVLVGWLVLKIKDQDGDIPVIDDINLNV